MSPLEGKLQTTISTVVEWHTRIHSTTVDILTLLLWNEIIVCHTTTVDIPLLLWNEFILCHTTTHCGMTKFSLSLWECYIRTEEKCGLKFPHSSLKAHAQFHHARQNLRCLSGWDGMVFNHSWLRHLWLKPFHPARWDTLSSPLVVEFLCAFRDSCGNFKTTFLLSMEIAHTSNLRNGLKEPNNLNIFSSDKTHTCLELTRFTQHVLTASLFPREISA